MPTAGAMDRIGLSLANALAGNPANTAGLEIGVMGPDLLVEADSVRIALVGPLSPALIDGPDAAPKPLDSDRSHLLKRGQVLRVGLIEGASTAYLAVAGGFDLPAFMGSLSTYSRAGIGGFDGRKLAAGDLLPLAKAAVPAGNERRIAQPFDYGSGPLRVVWGPQADYFSEEGRRTFVEAEYRVSKEADRMGIRFEGPTIAHAKSVDTAAPTSSPTASRPAPSRCPAPACRSCCWPTGRRSAAIPRSPPSRRSICRASDACCPARPCASPPSPSRKPRPCGAIRTQGSSAPSPPSLWRARQAVSTWRGSTKIT